MRSPVVLALAVVAAGSLIGVVRSGHVTAQEERSDADPAGALGAALYARDCAGCHGPDGEGSPRGIPIADAGEAGAHYALVTGRMPLRDEDDEPRRGSPKYDGRELAALVDHVAGLGDGPPLPDLDWRAADVSDGGALYRLHCGACHSATAIGGALAYDHTAPSLMPSEPSVVAAAVITGPGAMPSFAPQGFTEDELADIVAYVQEIRTPVDRGGWPIFRAGRVDEALFAWLVAVPVVLVTVAWIARRVR